MKKYAEFSEARTDMAFCFETLKKMSEYDLCAGIEWTKKNFDRFGKFRADNSYQKIPRDSARLAMLCLCTLINKDLATGKATADEIMHKIICINYGLKMLDPADFHRAQCAIYLEEVTLAKFSEHLTTLGIIEDFKQVTQCIEDHKKELHVD